jgi:hypothetical protein
MFAWDTKFDKGRSLYFDNNSLKYAWLILGFKGIFMSNEEKSIQETLSNDNGWLSLHQSSIYFVYPAGTIKFPDVLKLVNS